VGSAGSYGGNTKFPSLRAYAVASQQEENQYEAVNGRKEKREMTKMEEVYVTTVACTPYGISSLRYAG
jgi:hypothetical protein